MKKIGMTFFAAGFAALLITACGDERSGASSMTLSGTLSSSAVSSFAAMSDEVGTKGIVYPNAITDYVVYCVTFESSPTADTSEITSEGAWSLDLVANTPFGCFVNIASTNTPVATLVVKESSATGGFGGSGNSTMNLNGDTDLGALVLDLDSGEVVVPPSRVANNAGTSSSSMDLDADLHGKTFTMSCVATGDADIDANCEDFVAESPQVFFRHLQASEGGSTMNGLGVWASSTAFSGCGSIDFDDSGDSDILSDVTFTKADTGTFTANDTTCPRRDNAAARSSDNLDNYYAVGKLSPTGTGYTLTVEDEWDDSGCVTSDKTSVTFLPTSTDGTFVGAFVSSAVQSGSCAAENYTAAFNVRFVEQ